MTLPNFLIPQALRVPGGFEVSSHLIAEHWIATVTKIKPRHPPSYTDWLMREGLMQMASEIRGVPKSHRADPHTSYEAAQKAAGRAKAVRTGILLSLNLYGPQTADEMAQRVGMKREDVARRCSELLQDGKICRKETGTHDGKPVYHTRQTPTGSNACVYYLVSPL